MYLFDIYIDLKEGGEFNNTEIVSFCTLRGIKLKAWEVETLFKMQRAVREGYTNG